MKYIKSFFLVSLLSLFSNFSFARGEDWGNFGKYENENSKIGQNPPVVIFMGNSITEGWVKDHPEFFSSHNYAGRGISGQTTYQMLLRFRDDVINLKPEIVVINGGINDIAENNHPYNEERTYGNIISMAQLAQLNGIGVILTSVLPADSIPWRGDRIKNVSEKVKSLNSRIKEYADSHGLIYVDYYSSMANENGGLNKKFTKDGVHPTPAGYDVMETLIQPAISEYQTSK